MATESELEAASWKVDTIDTLVQSTLMKTVLAFCHSEVHHKEPKSYTNKKAVVTDVLEDQQETLIAQRGRVREKAIPVVPVKGQGDSKHGDCRQWTS